VCWYLGTPCYGWSLQKRRNSYKFGWFWLGFRGRVTLKPNLLGTNCNHPHRAKKIQKSGNPEIRLRPNPTQESESIGTPAHDARSYPRASFGSCSVKKLLKSSKSTKLSVRPPCISPKCRLSFGQEVESTCPPSLFKLFVFRCSQEGSQSSWGIERKAMHRTNAERILSKEAQIWTTRTIWSDDSRWYFWKTWSKLDSPQKIRLWSDRTDFTAKSASIVQWL